ncbi:RHS repeat protein [bacterium]|nr:RHS repeat protein [bacterium]
MNFFRRLASVALLGGLSLSAFAYDISCGNDDSPPPPDCEDVCPCPDDGGVGTGNGSGPGFGSGSGSGTGNGSGPGFGFGSSGSVGVNPINPYKGDLHREVTDLTTYGEAPVSFKRIFHSRTLTFNAPYWDFGSAQTWQHNWNHEMRQLSSKTFGFFDIKLRYADGREYNFVAADATGAQLVPPAANGDRLYRWPGSTVGYTLITPKGTEYHFQRVGSPKFQLKEVRDGKGHTWTLTHNSAAKIIRIANAYGRYLDIQRGLVGGVECITRVVSSDGRAVDYAYTNWSPTNTPTLTAVTYPDTEVAAYTWVGSDSPTTGRPLLSTADDPMYGGAGALTSYTYNYNAIFNFGGGPYLVTGTVLEEKNLTTGASIVSLPLGGGADAKIVQGNGAEISRLYDKGQVSGKRDAAGRLTSFTRSSGGFGFIATTTQPNGGVTTYTRDFAGRVLTQTNPLGHTRTYTYNLAGYVLSFTDELGRVTTTTRDSSNRPTRVDRPGGTYETWTYNATGQVLTHRRANGGIQTYAYYTAGQPGGLPGDLKTSTDPLGNVTTYTHAASGQVLTRTDALSRTSTTVYSAGARPIRIIYPDATFREIDYDLYGNVIQTTNELGHATNYTFNEYQRVASVTDPLGRTTTYQYGLSPSCSSCGYVDTLTRITYPSGRKIERTYDASGLLLTETDGAGTAAAATSTRVYSAAGDLASQSDPLGHVTSHTYDLLRRRLTTTDPLSRVTTFTYDAVGNPLTTTRADGALTTSTYDVRNRLATRTDAAANVIAYAYDPDGRLASLTDARSAVTTWTYDLAGRLTRKTYADATYEEHTYDAVGNRTLLRTPAAVTLACTYDVRNRELTCDWSDATPDVTRAYDAASRLVTLTTAGVVTHSYAYDAADQLLSEVTAPVALAPATFTVAYAYDVDGRRSQLTYPDTMPVIYTYTPRGQVSGISPYGPPPFATFTYDLAGRRTQKAFDNEVTTTYTYDVADQVTSIVHGKVTGELARYNYAYDTGGRRTAKTITGPGAPARAEVYGYDAIDQVTSSNYGTAGTETFAYDPMGNRTSASLLGQGSIAYTANALNQYSAINGAAPTYDVNGNTLTLPNRTFAYDGQSRLKTATLGTPGLSGYQVASFVYDARNRQVSRTLNGVTTYFIWDGWSLLAEYQVINSVLSQRRSYVHGPRQDEILRQDERIYFHEDALGDTVLTTNDIGRVSQFYSYTAFGEVTAYNSSGAITPSLNTRFLYTGREWISELGLNDHRNRFYLPSLGRWLNRDPIGERGGRNLYAFCDNNPLTRIDPFGQNWITDIGEAIWEGITQVFDKTPPFIPDPEASTGGGLAAACVLAKKNQTECHNKMAQEPCKNINCDAADADVQRYCNAASKVDG